jgi:hypothetical protein
VWYFKDVKIIYTAEFVKDISELLKKFPPKHVKVFGHHSTIAFRPNDLTGIEIGKESKFKIIGRVSDEMGDVLIVENTRSENKIPHITLSCAEGVVPKYSQDLLEKAIQAGTVEYFQVPVEVEVIEGYFDGEKDVIS